MVLEMLIRDDWPVLTSVQNGGDNPSDGLESDPCVGGPSRGREGR